MLERAAGFVLGCFTVLVLLVVGLVFAIPDAGRYLRAKAM